MIASLHVTTPKKIKGSILRGILIYFVVAMTIFVVFVQVSHLIITPLEALGKGFFYAVSQQNYDAAYMMFSKELKKGTSKEAFIQFLKESKLEHVDRSEWHTPVEQGKRGKILGVIYLKSGEARALELIAVQEPSSDIPWLGDVSGIPGLRNLKAWKIYSFNWSKNR